MPDSLCIWRSRRSEISQAWIVPADQLTDDARSARKRIERLDLVNEKARYGANTRGGVRISVPGSA
jgi:hypothetical protein